jgi:hypothetical protein
MTLSDTPRTTAIVAPAATLNWSSIIAGTVAAAAIALVMHAFAAAIGISVSSAAPTWRDASFALVLLSGLYLLVTAIISYGFGAYVAARLQPRTGVAFDDDLDYREGTRGLLVWALATLLTALMALAIAQMTPRLAAPGAGAGPSTSVAGENIIAFDLDRLFRGERRPPGETMDSIRSEAARILLSGSSHRGILPDDRAYLVRLVSGVTGLAQPEAERRVAAVAESARDNITRARQSAVILAFMAAAAALAGAAVAWYAAGLGGRHREGLEEIPTLWRWGTYRRM